MLTVSNVLITCVIVTTIIIVMMTWFDHVHHSHQNRAGEPDSLYTRSHSFPRRKSVLLHSQRYSFDQLVDLKDHDGRYERQGHPAAEDHNLEDRVDTTNSAGRSAAPTTVSFDGDGRVSCPRPGTSRSA
jgi:hypothetical protein